MKCPGCGQESLDLFETCKHCGPPPGSRGDRGGDFVEMLDDDAIEVEDDDLGGAISAGPVFVEDDASPPFRIDDDLFIGYGPAAHEVPGTPPGSVDWGHHHEGGPAADDERSGPTFVAPDEEWGSPADEEPSVVSDGEVPERYWAPEIAGLGRRALALLVDQLLLMAILGIFYLGALVALRRNNLATGLFLTADALQASALPFALLALLLSLSYSIVFHGSTGRTPGKALFGIEVRAGDGGTLSWSRAILRWLGAVLGLACAGVGVVWALFEPRRRGWADLISGTVVARPQREPALEVSRR